MQADLFGTKKNRPDIKSGELPIPTFTYHLPLRGNHPSGRRRITDNRKDMLFVPLQVSVSAMLVYIHQKNIAQVFILERYFFVSIYPAAIPCTYLAVFLATALPLCL